MATKPTRVQQRACDDLAEALYLITRAARSDDPLRLGPADLDDLAGRIARVSPAFDRDAIIARALRRRVDELGLGQDAFEMLTLLDAEVRPLDMLLKGDDDLRALVARLEEELGEP